MSRLIGTVGDGHERVILDWTDAPSKGGKFKLSTSEPFEEITSLDAWVGQKGESFPIGQPAKIVETFDFTREGEIYVTTGSSSGRNTYIRRGETLSHQKHGEKVTATLQPNGELA